MTLSDFILFYFILIYFDWILFYFILFYFIAFLYLFLISLSCFISCSTIFYSETMHSQRAKEKWPVGGFLEVWEKNRTVPLELRGWPVK